MRKIITVILATGLVLSAAVKVQAEAVYRETFRVKMLENQVVSYCAKDDQNTHFKIEQATVLFFELVDEGIMDALVTLTWHETGETFILSLFEGGYLIEGVTYGDISFSAPGFFTLSSWVRLYEDPNETYLNIHIEVLYRYILVSPSLHKFFLNGEQIELPAFNIRGYNFLRIHDLSYALKDTDSRFDISSGSLRDDAITIQASPFVDPEGLEYAIARPVVSHIRFHDRDGFADIAAYLISDFEYLKLRDLANELNFKVDWNEESASVLISA